MVFCSECGHKFEGAFCPECGTKAAGGAAAAAPKPAAAAAPKPAAAAAPRSAGKVAPAAWTPGHWELFDGLFKNKAAVKSGSGIASLAGALDDNTLYWGMYQYNEQYCIRIKWRPGSVGALKKVKANQSEQSFLDFAGDKTKVTLEVLGLKNFNDATVWECIKPGSGMKVIQD